MPVFVALESLPSITNSINNCDTIINSLEYNNGGCGTFLMKCKVATITGLYCFLQLYVARSMGVF